MNYIQIWRTKWTCDDSTTLEEMAVKLEEAATKLRQYAKAGITLETPVEDDCAFLVTTDPEVAKKFRFLEEVEPNDDN